MDEQKILGDRFEANRKHLYRVAYRMLGSPGEAEDAVQEAWLRLSRAGADDVDNLSGWLTTVVARICLDMLRARKTRREEPLEAPDEKGGEEKPAAASVVPGTIDPEQEALLADSVGLALLVVLQTLAPAERVAFVLHDMFDLSFDEIASVVGRTPVATRQLASRARRRVQGQPTVPEVDLNRQRGVIEAFLAASRGGDFDGLLAVLDPDVVVRADGAAVKFGSAPEMRGADAVASAFKGRARNAQVALVDGAPGVVVAPNGKLLLVLRAKIANGFIIEVEAIADPQRLAELELAVL
ncbi:sigma-70 family RNA polymerase sigma factor [Reyranella massiliensis]|uniref:sigma-70 family RNA polymerase sigma factor n=1 Tax=Reyranella massiliensis TaxID=445220 RepID=UPI0002D93DE4|nr:sigma-70 family RNA polymerase sigma factor [Reyranella massiliensis]